DTEHADLSRERKELAADPGAEEDELARIYERRGLDPNLARQVAKQLMARDALGAHARDELGITAELAAKPLQAAAASAATFAVGAALPIVVSLLAHETAVLAVSLTSLVALAGLGALAAGAGGASPWLGAARVTFWGALAMAATALIGRLFGTTVG
ncbi:MAG TPA: VIT1/CCC1 transporter family protein, partial [Vicinamibacterales bacterium]|nr:VIT1/CCC1 transporter family protein [Vicinamibacterales bacterium]